MIYKNLHIENAQATSDIRVIDGKIVAIEKTIEKIDGEDFLDCHGMLALPPLVESHIHLDTAMTVGDPDYNKSGTLFEGISLWSKRKEKLSFDDVQERALKAIKLEAENGVQFIRTHVDVCDPNLTALTAMLDLKNKVKDFVDMQIIAFPQEGILSYVGGAKLVKQAIDLGADGIGAIPHYEFTREQAIESINYVMKIAVDKNILVDIHCDETDDESSRGLETLVARAVESGIGDLVTASHTTAMHSYSDAYVGRLMRVISKSRINFVCNPLVNINLQGRYDTYPKRRGLTRVNELLKAGLNVSFGQDDIRDPWYPMGSGNLVDVVFMGVHCSQLMGYEDLLNSYCFITHNGARTLNLKDYGIKIGNTANFVIYDANNFYDVLLKHQTIKYSIRNGKVIFERSSPELISNI